MVKASRGLRTGTRRKLSKAARGKFTVTPYLREFREDERVTVMPNPSSHKGMPHVRFKGASGIVRGKRGNSYTVEVRLGEKKKVIIARPEHLVPVSA
jgi:large subunit ribosomal protein L21e